MKRILASTTVLTLALSLLATAFLVTRGIEERSVATTAFHHPALHSIASMFPK